MHLNRHCFIPSLMLPLSSPFPLETFWQHTGRFRRRQVCVPDDVVDGGSDEYTRRAIPSSDLIRKRSRSTIALAHLWNPLWTVNPAGFSSKLATFWRRSVGTQICCAGLLQLEGSGENREELKSSGGGRGCDSWRHYRSIPAPFRNDL
jgi:hypothetical protein